RSIFFRFSQPHSPIPLGLACDSRFSAELLKSSEFYIKLKDSRFHFQVSLKLQVSRSGDEPLRSSAVPPHSNNQTLSPAIRKDWDSQVRGKPGSSLLDSKVSKSHS